MRKVICAVLIIIIIAMGSTCVAQETDLQETYMSYYRAMIREAVRFDYQDFGEGAVGYQYALVFIDETDTIPSLLLAELTSDGIRYIKVFQYDPAIPGLIEPLEPLNEYRNMLYTGEGGKGLLLWYSDGAFDSGIMKVRIVDGKLVQSKLWYGPNGTWPDDIQREEIVWTDVQ